MTTFMLSELGCNGDCNQGRLPCTCQEFVPFVGKINELDKIDKGIVKQAQQDGISENFSCFHNREK